RTPGNTQTCRLQGQVYNEDNGMCRNPLNTMECQLGRTDPLFRYYDRSLGICRTPGNKGECEEVLFVSDDRVKTIERAAELIGYDSRRRECRLSDDYCRLADVNVAGTFAAVPEVVDDRGQGCRPPSSNAECMTANNDNFNYVYEDSDRNPNTDGVADSGVENCILRDKAYCNARFQGFVPGDSEAEPPTVSSCVDPTGPADCLAINPLRAVFADGECRARNAGDCVDDDTAVRILDADGNVVNVVSATTATYILGGQVLDADETNCIDPSSDNECAVLASFLDLGNFLERPLIPRTPPAEGEDPLPERSTAFGNALIFDEDDIDNNPLTLCRERVAADCLEISRILLDDKSDCRLAGSNTECGLISAETNSGHGVFDPGQTNNCRALDDRECVVQFMVYSETAGGCVEPTTNEDCARASRLCLDGPGVGGGAADDCLGATGVGRVYDDTLTSCRPVTAAECALNVVSGRRILIPNENDYPAGGRCGFATSNEHCKTLDRTHILAKSDDTGDFGGSETDLCRELNVDECEAEGLAGGRPQDCREPTQAECLVRDDGRHGRRRSEEITCPEGDDCAGDGFGDFYVCIAPSADDCKNSGQDYDATAGCIPYADLDACRLAFGTPGAPNEEYNLFDVSIDGTELRICSRDDLCRPYQILGTNAFGQPECVARLEDSCLPDQDYIRVRLLTRDELGLTADEPFPTEGGICREECKSNEEYNIETSRCEPRTQASCGRLFFDPRVEAGESVCRPPLNQVECDVVSTALGMGYVFNAGDPNAAADAREGGRVDGRLLAQNACIKRIAASLEQPMGDCELENINTLLETGTGYCRARIANDCATGEIFFAASEEDGGIGGVCGEGCPLHQEYSVAAGCAARLAADCTGFYDIFVPVADLTAADLGLAAGATLPERGGICRTVCPANRKLDKNNCEVRLETDCAEGEIFVPASGGGGVCLPEAGCRSDGLILDDNGA
ncbi:MAG: hypothetical protein ACR2QC_06770, partial [Gammaproteobacteria bacterium]